MKSFESLKLDENGLKELNSNELIQIEGGMVVELLTLSFVLAYHAGYVCGRHNLI